MNRQANLVSTYSVKQVVIHFNILLSLGSSLTMLTRWSVCIVGCWLVPQEELCYGQLLQ